MEKTSVPSERSPAGSVSSSQNYHDGCFPDGLGGSRSRMPSSGSLVRRAAELAYKLFGTTGSLPGSQTVLTAVGGLSCVNQYGQHDGSFLPEPSRRITFSPPIQDGKECSSLGSSQIPVSQSSLYPRSSEFRSRLDVETEDGEWGMET